MQFAGVFTQPLIQRCLDQGAEGHRLNFGQAIGEAGHEISQNWAWFRRRLVGQVIAALVLLTIAVLVVVLASNDGADKTTAMDPSVRCSSWWFTWRWCPPSFATTA